MAALLQRWPVSSFVTLTFVVALAPFAIVYLRGVNPFDDPGSMPLLLVMVWSPNIAAVIVSGAEGTLRPLFGTMLRTSQRPLPWLLALLPLAIIALVTLNRDPGDALPISTLALLVGLNLMLGPLGEELGWRGFLLPRLLPVYGTLGAALIVGALWAVWHAPLWFIDSPQARIPFGVFCATVVCFSVILTSIWLASDGSLWPVVLFHLAANVSVAWAELTDRMTASEAYSAALPMYTICAALAAGWAWSTTRATCPS